MSEQDDIDTGEALPPRLTQVLYGHDDAEQVLLDSYRSGRMPHAWLIGGAAGIGKATLAYRVARFVLANPDPSAPAVQNATSLAVPPENPAARRFANEAHPDFLVLKREINEKTGKLFTEIRVEDARRSVPFFGSTAGESGWRIAVVNPVDELNASSANSLLKVIEEPPERALLFLVSHMPGQVLATIRSRCRRLTLRPLSNTDVARAAAAALGRSPTEPAISQAAAGADGSVTRALELLDGATLELRRKVLDLLAQLPNPDPRALHAVGDAIGGSEPRTLATFLDIVNGWLASHAGSGVQDTPRLARFAHAWDKINGAARDVDTYNIERKPLVFAVFASLAEASRG